MCNKFKLTCAVIRGPKGLGVRHMKRKTFSLPLIEAWIMKMCQRLKENTIVTLFVMNVFDYKM